MVARAESFTGRSRKLIPQQGGEAAGSAFWLFMLSIGLLVPATVNAQVLPGMVSASPVETEPGRPSLIDYTTSSNLDLNGLFATDTMFLHLERQEVVLAAPVSVDISTPGFYGGGPLSPKVLAAGTLVNSYLLHTDDDDVVTPASLAAGTLIFEQRIVGVIVTTNSLNATDGALGVPGTTYYTGSNRGLEFGDADHVFLSADSRRLDYRFRTKGIIDEVRVLTLTEPIGPYLRYEFEGDAEDVTGNGNHGVVTGPPVFFQGPLGRAVYFNNPVGSANATQYVSVPNLSPLGMSPNSFTVGVLVNSTDTAQTNGRLFGNYFSTSGVGINYNATVTPNAGIFFRDLFENLILFFSTPAGPEAVVTDGEWHWMVLVVDRAAGETRGYIDGAVQAGSLSGFGTTIRLDELRIGSANDTSTTGRGFGARLTAVDEFRVYDVGLTDAEVQALFTPVPEPSSLLQGCLLGWGYLAWRTRARTRKRREISKPS